MMTLLSYGPLIVVTPLLIFFAIGVIFYDTDEQPDHHKKRHKRRHRKAH